MEGHRVAAEWIGSRSEVRARVAIGWEEGFSKVGELLEREDEIVLREIPGFPSDSRGVLALGRCGEVPVAVLDLSDESEGDRSNAASLLRVLRLLGMEIVLLVGVGRGVGAEALARGLFLAEDQLNLTGWNPLIGANFDEFGPRFPDMSEAFDSRLRRTALDLARRSVVPVRAGIFAGVSQARWDWLMRMGPADQEVELGLFRKAGADMVG
jgi:purine-nucleoside phosphorylase